MAKIKIHTPPILKHTHFFTGTQKVSSLKVKSHLQEHAHVCSIHKSSERN